MGAADKVFLDRRGALASPSVVPAARGPSPWRWSWSRVTAPGWTGARPGRPDAAGLEDRAPDGRAAGGVPADPGRSGARGADASWESSS